MKKHIYLLVALLLMGASYTQAQRELTLYNARYLQQASFANAAFTPECKVNIGGLALGSTHLSLENNGFTRKSLGNIAEGPEGAAEELDRLREVNYLAGEFRKDLHFGFRLKEKNYLSFNISPRSQTTIAYNKNIAGLVAFGNGVDPSDPGADVIPEEYYMGERISFDNSAVEHTTWTEFGIQYARKLVDDKLSVGIRPKFLLGHANITTDNMTLGLTTDPTNFGLKLDGSYSYRTSLPNDSVNGESYSPFSNIGFGADIGVSYDINEKFNISASANDIGFINWKFSPRNFSATDGLVLVNGAPINGGLLQVGDSIVPYFEELGADLADSLNNQFGPDTAIEEYRTWLTARYNLGFNYTFAEKHNVGLLLNAHMIKRNLRAAMSISYNFRVRKWFGLHVNYSIYNRSFTNLGAGLSFNIFPWQFYIMTDNALFFLPGSTNNHLRAGINWTFGCSNDKDKDGIPDNKDDCPKTPGIPKFNGCPDTDGDGIMDKLDSCVTEPGPEVTNGCPDRDNDGIMDSEDDCPDTPGIPEFNGCPDTDEDGIKDSADDCPNDAGLPEFNGCPDTDGDGIKDLDDKCPEKPGSAEFEGCPDTDGDGLPDYKDSCPETAGPVDNNGCPYGDKDGDGVIDKDDKCIDTPGPAENNGCPLADLDGDGVLDKDDACIDTPGPAENGGCPYSDLDGDGVLDKDDRCPQTPGPTTNQGCPEIKEEEQEVLNTAFENLEFETGSDVIKKSSYESLDNLAELLVNKEDWRIMISGHTDNVGNDANNMKLSEKRSNSVANYLNSKGVPRDRMIVKWYGETKPIADNGTAEGRAQNRRVEMEIVFD